MQGAKPLASPGAGWDAALGLLVESGLWCGACFLCRLPTPPCRYPEGACRLCRLPTLPLAYFLAPIPPTPFPAGRGRLRLFYARGFAPCIPGGWVGCGTGVACGKRVVAGACILWRLPAFCFSFVSAPIPRRGRAPAMHAVPIPKAPCGRKIGHKPLVSVNNQYSGKVLGGLGDSFKSPPAFSSAFSPSFPPFPRQMLPDGRGCGSVPAGA